MIDNRNGSIATNNDSNTKNPTVVKQDSQLANFSPFILKKKRNLDLKLLAKERTWLQIVIDDSASSEYVFEPGDTSVWQAKGKFQMRIGNGAGVRLYLNGNDLGEIGKQMEVVKLILTKDGVQRNKF